MLELKLNATITWPQYYDTHDLTPSVVVVGTVRL